MGVISGDMSVDGRERNESFQRQTGYVMQQDIHLETSTVREALEFSALLRQPLEYSRAERLAYVDKVIDLLDMQPYADAVVGVPGSGLNVERKSSLGVVVLIRKLINVRTEASDHRRRTCSTTETSSLSR